jgi:hypothetical protein
MGRTHQSWAFSCGIHLSTAGEALSPSASHEIALRPRCHHLLHDIFHRRIRAAGRTRSKYVRFVIVAARSMFTIICVCRVLQCVWTSMHLFAVDLAGASPCQKVWTNAKSNLCSAGLPHFILSRWKPLRGDQNSTTLRHCVPYDVPVGVVRRFSPKRTK